jgi:hypothetical protein
MRERERERARGGNPNEGRGNCVRDASPPLSQQGDKNIGGSTIRGDHPKGKPTDQFGNICTQTWKILKFSQRRI